jgi:hypothetical protein
MIGSRKETDPSIMVIDACKMSSWSSLSVIAVSDNNANVERMLNTRPEKKSHKRKDREKKATVKSVVMLMMAMIIPSPLP